jgi:hypothetical protein
MFRKVLCEFAEVIYFIDVAEFPYPSCYLALTLQADEGGPGVTALNAGS